MRIRLLVALALLATLSTSSGCFVAGLASAMSSNFEQSKEIEVLAKYDGLTDQTVAVLVDVPLSTQYEHPMVVANIAENMTRRIGMNVEGVRMLPARQGMTWQYNVPGWRNLPYGEVADELGVDRVVLIDVYEYRLNPPGNSYLWEGVCAANVGIIERDGLDPDFFVDEYNVLGKFPLISYVPREGASANAIQTGTLAQFVEECGWLFYTHLEPKYPDG